MQLVDKLTMFSMTVSDMPKAKAFYVDKLGLKVKSDYRQDDDNWWVSLALPAGDVAITLARHPSQVKTSTIAIYFTTSDVVAAHKELSDKGIKVNDVMDDLYGPGSGVRFFNFEDPDGNWIHLAQA